MVTKAPVSLTTIRSGGGAARGPASQLGHGAGGDWQWHPREEAGLSFWWANEIASNVRAETRHPSAAREAVIDSGGAGRRSFGGAEPGLC